MRIAYIIEPNFTIETGVIQKIKQQVTFWANEGHTVLILSLNVRSKTGVIQENGKNSFKIRLITHEFSKRTHGFFGNYFNKVLSVNHLRKELLMFNPDIIYYRQGIWFPGLPGILKSSPTIIELNTFDLDEMGIQKKIRRSVYKYGRQKLLDSANGFIAVTTEIERKYKSQNKPIIAISNGIDIAIIPETQPKQSSRAQIIFVGTPGYPWNGFDKVVVMAKSLPAFDFHIIGPEIPDKLPNLKSYGYLSRQDLVTVYKQVDIGIGTLALHRKKLEEASPLKVREYLAYGLPTIIGYHDTDLHEMEFILNIGNYEDNVEKNIEKIKYFILRWKGKRVKKEQLEDLIGLKAKEHERLKFFEDIIKSFNKVN